MIDLSTAGHSPPKKIELTAVLNGHEQFVCTYAGTSQYRQSNSGDISNSACGLACLNFVRYVISLGASGETEKAILDKLFERETMEDIVSVCALWSSNAHLDVDDIFKTPLFEATLRLTSTEYGQAERNTFRNILRKLDSPHHHRTSSNPKQPSSNIRAVVITRPPEIVACAKIAGLFVLFDSHPRPSHPDGAAFIFNTSLEKTADYLAGLLSIDPHLFAPNSGLQWQAELLSHVSGHFFQKGRADMSMSREALYAFMDANCAILRYKNTESAAQTEVKFVREENETLQREIKSLREQMRYDQEELSATRKEVQQLRQALQSGHSYGSRDAMVPTRLSVTSSGHNSTPRPGDRFQGVKEDAKGKGKEKVDDIDIALQLHLTFQDEDARQREYFRSLQLTENQEVFECSICMEEMPIDDVANADLCGHRLCRGCMKGYVSSRLDERKYPIMCPVCSASNTSGEIGRISDATIQQLGISERLYAILVDIQMGSFSIPLYCKKCKRSAPVDKSEYDNMKILACPFPRCCYLWCKDCQQEIPLGNEGPPHSCDGSNELQSLMDKRGWKHCPGCRTPTEKISGCNHMTCSSPGCNTHFCYTCGILIIKSSNRNEISREVSKHYNGRCLLFAVPDGD